VEQMIGFARRLDPGLTGRDFADAGRRLDQWGDGVFAPFGLSLQDVSQLREEVRSLAPELNSHVRSSRLWGSRAVRV
jgi:hypothetical protein